MLICSISPLVTLKETRFASCLAAISVMALQRLITSFSDLRERELIETSTSGSRAKSSFFFAYPLIFLLSLLVFVTRLSSVLSLAAVCPLPDSPDSVAPFVVTSVKLFLIDATTSTISG